MRKYIVLAAIAAFGIMSAEVKADGLPPGVPPANPFGNAPYPESIGHGPASRPVLSHIFHRGGATLPVYQAAPWYLYWPYDAHFMTPAPIFNGGYGTPVIPYAVNPYFPVNPYPMGYGR